jgi:hypothetical protein
MALTRKNLAALESPGNCRQNAETGITQARANSAHEFRGASGRASVLPDDAGLESATCFSAGDGSARDDAVMATAPEESASPDVGFGDEEGCKGRCENESSDEGLSACRCDSIGRDFGSAADGVAA